MEIGLHWEKYYATLWQCLSTLVTQFLISIILTGLFIQTLNRFKAEHKKQPCDKINKKLELLSTIYLLCIWLYVIPSLLFRLYIVVLNGDIYCWIPDYLMIFIISGRVTLLQLFIFRLHTSFRNTIYAYRKSVLIFLSIMIIIGALVFGSWLLYNNILFAYGENTLTSTNCATISFNFGLAAGPVILYDSLMSAILLVLFIRRLTMLVKTSMVVNERRTSHVNDLMLIMAKFTVLLTVANVTTWILSLSLGILLPSAGVCIDGLINALCGLYCFSFYNNDYYKNCKYCHFIVYKCYICCIFEDSDKSLGIENENGNAMPSDTLTSTNEATANININNGNDNNEKNMIAEIEMTDNSNVSKDNSKEKGKKKDVESEINYNSRQRQNTYQSLQVAFGLDVANVAKLEVQAASTP